MAKITLTGAQHRTLNAITAKPLTRKRIAEAAFGGNSVNFAPILEPLVKAKLVKVTEVDVDGKTETLFSATATGRTEAKKPSPARANGKAEHKPLPKVGGVITKTYLGKDYTVKVTKDGFEFKGKTYASLTAAAKAVRGTDQEINGWLFFGLTKGDK